MRGRSITTLLLIVASFAVAIGVGPSDRVRAEPAAPNIVLIYTDDQRWDELSFMPTVTSEIARRGVTFANAFAVNPWCCPSRVSVLRGQYSHSTQIYKNQGSFGGFANVRKLGLDQSTIATWLQAAGYRTALMGKYLNGYNGDAVLSYVPPGWDSWMAFETSPGEVPYFDYRMSVDGQIRSFGSNETDYSTDVLARDADAFIRSTPADQPLYLHLTPVAPHTPRTPAPRYLKAPCPARSLPESVGEFDMSDKPRYAQAWTWDQSKQVAASTRWIKSCRALLATDDLVEAVLAALADTGRLANTLIVYASDNGELLGEHRRFGKVVPYEESIRIPLVMRFDAGGVLTGTTRTRLAANIDITATFVDAAGVTPPYTLDGRSLLPLARGAQTTWRSGLLIEHFDTPGATDFIPSYCAIRTPRDMYIRYDTDDEPLFEELYDLSTDPLQLTNLMAGSPNDAVLSRRDALLARLRQLCSPPPPSYEI
ncbi:MAG TPA: sulfatase [Actinomycetota bacterium]|nr:sulfatase [Actinomycetota bacterium]